MTDGERQPTTPALDHIIELTDGGWTLMHPLACRPNLFTCPVNQAAGEEFRENSPTARGRFSCGLNHRGEFVVGEATSMLACHTDLVLFEVAAERSRQDAKWGPQNHPDGTGITLGEGFAAGARALCQAAAASGRLTWRHILREEVAEAFDEHDPARLRAELVQLAAVAVAWVEAIDIRTTAVTNPGAGD